MWLAIAVLIAVAVDGALSPRSRRHSGWRLGVVALALAAILPAGPGKSTTTVPAFFQRWSQEGIPDGTTVLVAPFFRDGAGADPMLWAAVAGDGFRMPEAYAFVPLPDGKPIYGSPPTPLTDMMQKIQDSGETVVVRGELRQQIAASLRASGTQDVIVGPMANQSQMVGFFTDLFDQAPTAVDGVYLWRGVDGPGAVPPL
jgi:hypothetical protein